MDALPDSRKWRVFIVTHRNIFPWLYAKDQEFNLTNYRFINISSGKLTRINRFFYRPVDLAAEPGFIRLGDAYVETEAIYNIYKNPKFYDELDWIGFLHYDFEFRLSDGSGNITERINRYLQDKTKAHIAFKIFNTKVIYDQKMLMDEAQPKKISGTGDNCLDHILRDYNNYFNTHYTLGDLFSRPHLNMCSSFLVDVATFEKMMGFIAGVIESKTIDRFIIQGHLMERYYAVFLLFENDNFLTLDLPHHNFLKNIK